MSDPTPVPEPERPVDPGEEPVGPAPDDERPVDPGTAPGSPVPDPDRPVPLDPDDD